MFEYRINIGLRGNTFSNQPCVDGVRVYQVEMPKENTFEPL